MPAPAPHTDALIRRLEGEIEERNALIQGIAQDAQARGDDLNASELEQMNRAKDRISALAAQLDPLRESSKIAIESRQRAELIQQEIGRMRGRGNLPGEVEYRSAGQYVADMYHAGLGDKDAFDRLEVYNRAAAHQTTTDNPGLLPERIVEPVLNGVDVSRPVVSSIGPTALGAGSWAYARVTQHTQVGVQAAEKAELASRKMTVTKTAITAPTYGGYVNVSKQDIRRTSPQILDMVIADLAGQYAIETEDDCADDLVAGATAGTLQIPATATALGIVSAVWAAVGQSATALRTANLPATRPILYAAPDMMGLVGPFFPGINPQNAASSGFNASDLAVPGSQGSFSGIPEVVMSPAFAAGTLLFVHRSGIRVFEDRYGAMQVNEPSVWGVQVGYAGDFETVILDAGAIISITQAA